MPISCKHGHTSPSADDRRPSHNTGESYVVHTDPERERESLHCQAMALQSRIFIGFLFCLAIVNDASPDVEDNLHLLNSVIMTQMNNATMCQQLYDHCVDGGNLTGDDGQRSPSYDNSPWNHLELTESGSFRCFCDVHECRKYGDCCPDIVLPDIAAVSTDARSVQEANRVETMTNHGFECQKLPLNRYQHRVYVYMRTSCPRTWQDNEVDDLCHRRVPQETSYDYTLDLPVTSRATNVTYLNVYCAICNEDTALEPLDIRIHCPLFHNNCMDDWSQWQYVGGQQRWRHLTNTWRGYSTYMTLEIVHERHGFKRFFTEHGMRACPEDLVNTCPPDWSGDIEQRRLCSAYALMVSSAGPSGGGRVLYKNRHCAICNGIAANAQISCAPELKLTYRRFKDDHNRIAFYNGDNLTPSYSMLVDFMNDDGQARSIAGTSKCAHGEIFDAIRKACRPYTCGQRYRMDRVNGRCIEVGEPEVNNTADDDATIFSDCPKVTFNEDQFVYLSNDTIYVNETDTIYKSSDYEPVNDTSMVLVCASLSTEFPLQKVTNVKVILSTACVLVSLTCLTIHILVYLYVPQLRNLPGKNLLSLSSALFVAQFLFTFGMSATSQVHGACVMVAAIIHLCFLATFFWMNVMAFDVSGTFSGKSYLPSSNDSSFIKYSLYAWLSPLVIVCLAIANDLVEFLPGDVQPRYAEQNVCWINNKRALLVFFVVPLALLITGNMVLFVFTVVGIWRTTRATKFARENSSASGSGADRIQIILYVKLALIMGLTWLFGLVASLAEIEVLWYLFIVFNALQGAFIFFGFTFKWKILQLAQDRFRGKMAMRRRSSSSSSSYRTQMTSKSA